MKLTVIGVLLPLIMQFKAILFAPLMSLYESVPSLSQSYDAVLSLRNPWYEKKVTPTDEVIENITKKYKEKDYSKNAIVNVSFLVSELILLQKSNPSRFSHNVDEALTEINNFQFEGAAKIFSAQILITEQKDKKEKYYGLVAMATYFTDKIAAINYYNKGLDLNPYNLFLLNNLGRLYVELESYDNAKTVFSRIVTTGKARKKPEIISLGYSNIGVIELKQKNYPIALKNFNTALQINKKYDLKIPMANQYTNLALTYEAEDNIEKACVNYRRARIIYHKQYYDKQAEQMFAKLKEKGCI